MGEILKKDEQKIVETFVAETEKILKGVSDKFDVFLTQIMLSM